jgi:hypothetical protein
MKMANKYEEKFTKVTFQRKNLKGHNIDFYVGHFAM